MALPRSARSCRRPSRSASRAASSRRRIAIAASRGTTSATRMPCVRNRLSRTRTCPRLPTGSTARTSHSAAMTVPTADRLPNWQTNERTNREAPWPVATTSAGERREGPSGRRRTLDRWASQPEREETNARSIGLAARRDDVSRGTERRPGARTLASRARQGCRAQVRESERRAQDARARARPRPGPSLRSPASARALNARPRRPMEQSTREPTAETQLSAAVGSISLILR